MSDDSVDPAGVPPAPPWPPAVAEPTLPSLPTLPTLPSAAPRAPAALPTDLWSSDREATDMARHGGEHQLPEQTPLTQAGTTVHRYSAKELSEARRIKAVDNPAYGDLPKASTESQAQVDDLRRKAAKNRARNKRIGWYMALFGIALVVGIFVGAYVLFQQEDDNDEPVEPTVPAASVAPSVPPGAGATPIGEQITVVSGLEVINQAPVAGGGAATDIINDANEVVANLNGTTPP
jgi:hypothetical protein